MNQNNPNPSQKPHQPRELPQREQRQNQSQTPNPRRDQKPDMPTDQKPRRDHEQQVDRE